MIHENIASQTDCNCGTLILLFGILLFKNQTPQFILERIRVEATFLYLLLFIISCYGQLIYIVLFYNHPFRYL
jgi:hypothetical protein